MSNDECTAAHWGVWDRSPTKKKKATISARETNRTKKSMSTTAQTYWQSSAEIWEGQRNYSLKNEVDKDAISCFSIRKDWRFAVRAKSFALHWRSRGFFRGHVRSCEKGLWHWLIDVYFEDCVGATTCLKCCFCFFYIVSSTTTVTSPIHFSLKKGSFQFFFQWCVLVVFHSF